MSRKHYFAICLLVLSGAFAGGFVANRTVPVAHAQTLLPPAEVRGSAFTLVGPQGQVQASLHTGASGAELFLNDPNGRVRLELSPSGGVIVRDSRGRIAWQSPRRSGTIPASAE